MGLYEDKNKKVLAVAPMMGWTDTHCRYFHRTLSDNVLLYTEMITADAIIHGDQDRLLGFNEEEKNVAIQLGGSNPKKLKEAAVIAEQFGYNEINLNVGCPSDRVQSGTFGACLMKNPILVGECVREIKNSVGVPVTVKCRTGVDDQDETALDNLANAIFESEADALWVHARKAWLQGLSPKQNREIPPLEYDRVIKLKKDYPKRFIGINGGFTQTNQIENMMDNVDGVMVGRAAYQNPEIIISASEAVFGETGSVSIGLVQQKMVEYIQKHKKDGGRVHDVTRHMMGLFTNKKGAKKYRRMLATEATKATCDEKIINRAFGLIAA